MIRPYSQSDLGAVVNMVHKDDKMPVADIKERLEKWSCVVWEDSGVIAGAACYMREEEGEFNLRVYVDPNRRGQGIGSALCTSSVEALKAHGERGRITAKYRIDRGQSQHFFRERGFEYWYSMDHLAYDGPPVPAPALPHGVEIRPCDARRLEEFVGVMADAFIPQRRFFDFRPHDVREIYSREESRQRALGNLENMFVMLDHGKIVAILELEAGFIDTVGVDHATKGRGFGKAMMQFAINALLQRGHNTVETSVVLGNIPAWRLYNVLGFKRVQADEWACRWI